MIVDQLAVLSVKKFKKLYFHFSQKHYPTKHEIFLLISNAVMLCYWMCSRVCEMILCLSVRLSHHVTAAAAGLLLSATWSGDINRQWRQQMPRPSPVLPQHGAQQQMRAVSRLQLTYEAEDDLLMVVITHNNAYKTTT